MLNAQLILLINDSIISVQYATGYVTQGGTKWDDRMHILINVTSCLTLVGQAWTKTAFGVTLLKLANKWQQYILWFMIATMNAYMIAKVIVQWAKLCDEKSYDVWYRLDFCVGKKWRDDFKEGGNGEYLNSREFCICTINICSVQHHHGLRVCTLSMDHHLEIGDAQG